MGVCIWCLSDQNPPSEEHIFPDALGCPEELRFTGGEVCRVCNNKLGRLDRAVIKQLEPFAFMAGVRRKRGRPPIIEHRKNLWVENTGASPTIIVNTTAQPIHDGGRTIGPFSRSPWAVECRDRVEGDRSRISLSFTLVGGRNFVRGLYKIGLELLAFHKGSESVLADHYEPIRAFVLADRGARRIVYGPVGADYLNHDLRPLPYPGGRFAIAFRIAHFMFWVDLSTDHSLIEPAIDELRRSVGEFGWVVEPRM